MVATHTVSSPQLDVASFSRLPRKRCVNAKPWSWKVRKPSDGWGKDGRWKVQGVTLCHFRGCMEPMRDPCFWYIKTYVSGWFSLEMLANMPYMDPMGLLLSSPGVCYIDILLHVPFLGGWTRLNNQTITIKGANKTLSLREHIQCKLWPKWEGWIPLSLCNEFWSFFASDTLPETNTAPKNDGFQ